MGWAQQGSTPAEESPPAPQPAAPPGDAPPDTGPESNPAQKSAPNAEDARKQLDAAVQLYLDGDAEAARKQIQGLLGYGPELEVSVRTDALVWLADILYSEEGEKAARNALEALLSEDPEYAMDSFAHPPELSRFFEQIKAERGADSTPPPPPEVKLRPFPVLIFLPGGVYYYVNGRPLVGAAITTLQVASLTGSAALYVQLSEFPEELLPSEEAEVQKARTLRALNWTLATAGWLSFAVPVLYESGRWGTERAQLSIGTNGQQILLAGKF